MPKEGRSYPQCGHRGMQVSPPATGLWKTESCAIGTEQRAQRKSAIYLGITFCCTFKVHGDELEKVKVQQHFGRLLAQDDDDAQAVWLQIRKAQGVGCVSARCFARKT
jgi:hypothetical protein